MKKLVMALGILALFAGGVAAGDHSVTVNYDITNERDCRFHNHEVELDDKHLFITAVDHNDFEIEITPDVEVYIDNKKLVLDPEQQELAEDYYNLFMEMTQEAREIGWEGARIGLQGAGIGLKALGGVVKMIFTSYDEDDLERDMERAAEKIEARADRLEQRAELIEDMAYELEDRFDEFIRAVPELKRLDW